MLYMYINEYLELVAVICLYQELFFFFFGSEIIEKKPTPKTKQKNTTWYSSKTTFYIPNQPTREQSYAMCFP